MGGDRSETAPMAWHYADGRWDEGPDPVTEAWGEEDEMEVLDRLGYKVLFEVGSEGRGGFTVWKRPQPPRHLISTGPGELGEFFYVDAAPDLRDICARWAALARDAAVTGFIEGLAWKEFRFRREGEGAFANVVEAIARRVVSGVRQADEDPGQES